MSPHDTPEAGSPPGRLPSSPHAVWIADRRGRFTEVNSWACRLLGHDEADLLRCSVAELVRPEEADRLRSLTDALARGERVRDTWEIRRADGSYVSLDLTHTFTADGHWQSFGSVTGTGRGVPASTPDAARVAELEALVRQQDEKLDSQPTIEQAKGVLMRDLQFTDDEAFRYLVGLSQDTNVKLRTVAGAVIDSLRARGISATTARATFDELTELHTRLRSARSGS